MKNIIKSLAVITTIAMAAAAGYCYGALQRAEEESAQKTRYIGALMEGLHWFYQENKQEWNETFMHTQEYRRIEQLNEGYWEDLYYDWEQKTH